MATVRKSYLLNDLMASGKNVQKDEQSNRLFIDKNEQQGLLSTYLSERRIVAIPSQDEITQVYTHGVKKQITVKPDTLYSLIADFANDKVDGRYHHTIPMNVTSPSNLTGDAALDRENLYVQLAATINRRREIKVTASVIDFITSDVTKAVTEVGTLITQEGGFSGKLAKPIDVGDKTIALYNTSGTYSTSKALKHGTAVITAISGSIVKGQALAIEEQGDYTIKGNHHTLLYYAKNDLDHSCSEVTRVPMPSHGIGREMALNSPVWNPDMLDVLNPTFGDYVFEGDPVDPSKRYTLVQIFSYTDYPIRMESQKVKHETETLLYVDESDKAKLDAFIQALK